jgi:hypothetical protein
MDRLEKDVARTKVVEADAIALAQAELHLGGL